MVTVKKMAAHTLIVLLSLWSLTASAALTAFVDRNPVAVDESLTLTVESDSSVDGSPDFSVLHDDFDVLSQSSNTSIQIINGRTSRKIQWQVTLIPQRTGDIHIPAFEVDGDASPPLVLTVTAAQTPQSSDADAPLFMDVSVDVDEVYVQQQIVFTIQLYRAVNIAGNSTLSEPQISGVDAIVERLGDDREFQKTINGRRYVVFERKYAIFPQQSGALQIEPLLFDVNVLEKRRSNRGLLFDPFNQNTVRKRLRSEPVQRDIKPVPSGMVGNWLPARAVQLVENWSSDEFVVGEPVTRTIGLIADGLTAAQLPDVMGSVAANVKVYPDQPLLKDNKDATGITGMRQQKLAIIPTKVGKLTLPAIQLPWWNTQSKKLEVAKLPERTVTVRAAPPQTDVAPPATSTDVIDDAPARSSVQKQVVVSDVSPGWWPWLSLALGIGWLLTLIAWWRKGATGTSSAKPTSIDPSARRTLEKQLKEDCLKNDAPKARQLLLAWSKQTWPQHPPTSLPAMAQRCEAALAERLTELDAVLYAGEQREWQGEALWQAFSEHTPTPESSPGDADTVLEPLYRT